MEAAEVDELLEGEQRVPRTRWSTMAMGAGGVAGERLAELALDAR
jgi:hypothetical protein